MADGRINRKQAIIAIKADLFDLQTQYVSIRVQMEQKLKELNLLLQEEKQENRTP
jgi:hypothetical protein